jgi:hypothetical protein
MDFNDIVSTYWPVFLVFVTVVITFAKMHAEIAALKEKVKTLFELWNSKGKD